MSANKKLTRLVVSFVRDLNDVIEANVQAALDNLREGKTSKRVGRHSDRFEMNLEDPEIVIHSFKGPGRPPKEKTEVQTSSDRSTPVAKVDFKTSIRSLELPARAVKLLEKLNIETVGALTDVTVRRLMRHKNFGARSLREIRDALWAHGFYLRGDQEYEPKG